MIVFCALYTLPPFYTLPCLFQFTSLPSITIPLVSLIISATCFLIIMVAMSNQEAAGGPAPDQSFSWGNKSWGALSISDNSEGSSEERLMLMGKKPPASSSNNPTGMGIISTELLAAAAPSRSKGGRGGGVDKDGKGRNKLNREGKGRGCGGGGGGVGGESSDHEIHIWTERERRKKMRNMFANLHALLPQLPPKADKSTIVDEAVNYIKTLQQTVQKLQKQKLERLQSVATFGYEPPIITPQKLAFNSREAFLADQGFSSSKLAIDATTNSSNFLSVPPLPVVFQTWTSSNVVLNICGGEAHISVCSSKKFGIFTTICCVLEKHKIEVISAQVSSDSTRRMYMIQAQVNGGNSDQFTEAVSVEEIYKQAAGELMFWISS